MFGLNVVDQWVNAPAVAQDQELLNALESIQEQREADRYQARQNEISSRCRCIFNDGCGIMLIAEPIYPNTREGRAQREADERRAERRRQWRLENADRLRRDRERLREWCFASRAAMDRGDEPEAPPQLLEYGEASAAEHSTILDDILADMDRRERNRTDREQANSEQYDGRRVTPQERAARVDRLRESCAAAIEQAGVNGERCSPACQTLVNEGYRLAPSRPEAQGVSTCQ